MLFIIFVIYRADLILEVFFVFPGLKSHFYGVWLSTSGVDRRHLYWKKIRGEDRREQELFQKLPHSPKSSREGRKLQVGILELGWSPVMRQNRFQHSYLCHPLLPASSQETPTSYLHSVKRTDSASFSSL